MQSATATLTSPIAVGCSNSQTASTSVLNHGGNNGADVAGINDSNLNLSALKDGVKTQFVTREGVYKQMTVSDQLARPLRAPVAQGSQPVFNAPVRVSFLSLRADGYDNRRQVDESEDADRSTIHEKICFNIGRELYVFDMLNGNTAFDWTKPVDKRVYKGTYPTCHDFNHSTASHTSCSLIVGFSAGQVQLIDPFQKEYQASRLFNEDRLIDKSPVTCLRWIPSQPAHFAASHASGHIYIYDEELPCLPAAPVYVPIKESDGYAVSASKSRQPRNPIQRWSIGKGAIHQFEFSDRNASLMATVGQDGFLRVFKYATMELVCLMRSYFGALLSCAWSADARLIATGGEDDLLTVFSVPDKRVLCRGQGHKSWVSHVAFDPYVNSLPSTSINGIGSLSHSETGGGLSANVVGSASSAEDVRPVDQTDGPIVHRVDSTGPTSPNRPNGSDSWQHNFLSAEIRPPAHSLSGATTPTPPTVYRIGSVSYDTQLCLWDVCDEHLSAASIHHSTPSTNAKTSFVAEYFGGSDRADNSCLADLSADCSTTTYSNSTSSNSAPVKESKTNKLKNKFHKRGLSFGTRHSTNADRNVRATHSNGGGVASPPSTNTAATPTSATNADEIDDTVVRLFGTPQCPRMDAVPLIEPFVCKKISHERLTSVCFREESVVTACQEGYVCTWARPPRSHRF